MQPLPTVLVHICTADEWNSAQAAGELRPDSLASNGFVHLSTPEQVHLPANRLYAGRTDLVLLHIDPDTALLSGPLGARRPQRSRCDGVPTFVRTFAGEAVISVTSFLPDAKGRFAPVVP